MRSEQVSFAFNPRSPLSGRTRDVFPKSGFKAVSGVQLLNGLHLLRSKRITFRCFRAYIASFAISAIREAAKRSGGRVSTLNNREFRKVVIKELSALCALSPGQAGRDLLLLEREALVSIEGSELRPSTSTLPGADALTGLVRSPTRPVPVPRCVLRFLAQERRQSVTRTMIAFMLRGLTISRKGAVISGNGSAKLSWIAEVSGVSERAARYAKSELILLGWIGRDSGSAQWKLNRDGAYFSINLDWTWRRCASQTPARNEVSAAPEAGKGPHFAPPYKDMKTPYGSKNQKSLSGFQKNESHKSKRTSGANLSDIKNEDLFHLSRCEELYWQAIQRGLIPRTENSALNFLAAAVRARSIQKGDPARVFASLIRKRLWHHVTCEQEDVARRALARIRNTDPERFRTPAVLERSAHRLVQAG